jgi:hypothetical protein
VRVQTRRAILMKQLLRHEQGLKKAFRKYRNAKPTPPPGPKGRQTGGAKGRAVAPMFTKDDTPKFVPLPLDIRKDLVDQVRLVPSPNHSVDLYLTVLGVTYVSVPMCSAELTADACMLGGAHRKCASTRARW